MLSKTVLLPLNELLDEQERLVVEFPFVARVMNEGIGDIIRETLPLYKTHLTQRDFNEYLEAVIDRLDYNVCSIADSLGNDRTNQIYNEYATSEIYSMDFMSFLQMLFNKIIMMIQDVFMNQSIQVINTEMVRLDTLKIEVNINAHDLASCYRPRSTLIQAIAS